MAFPWHQRELSALLEQREALPHALLIRGPAGIGKLAFALALGRALLCESPADNGAACRRCAACRWLEQGAHPDFRVLEPEPRAQGEEGRAETEAGAQIAVDQVRSLREFIQLSTHRGRARVIVIHPAEAMNPSAANALLKGLEEPPPATHFLLVAHRWRRLLPTIRSRCRQVALQAPDAEAARAWLGARGIAEPQLALAHAGGAPLLASSFDAPYWERRAAFLRSVCAAEFDPLQLAEALREVSPAAAVRWMQQWSYDMLARACAGREPRYNPDFSGAVAEAAARAEPVALARFHRRTLRWQREVDHPLNARLFLEQVLLEYAHLRRGRPGPRAA